MMMVLINSPELVFVMRCLGMRLTPQHVHKLLLEFDDNGSGGVELGEFQRLVDNLVSEESQNIYSKMIVSFYMSYFQGIRFYETDVDIVRLMSNK